MRTASSAGLSALRLIEDEAARGRGAQILLRAGRDAAVYLLNKKRSELAEIEERYGVSIEVLIDDAFEGAKMAVESSGPKPTRVISAPKPIEPEADEDEQEDEIEEAEAESDETAEERAEEEDEGARQGRKRRRRRRGGRGRRRSGETAEGASLADEVPPAIEEGAAEPETQPENIAVAEKPKRRRRRRGGAAESEKPQLETEAVEIAPDSSPTVEQPLEEPPAAIAEEPAQEPKPKRGGRRKDAAKAEPAAPVAEEEAAPVLNDESTPAADVEAKPKRRTRKAKAPEGEPAGRSQSAEVLPMPDADNDSAAEQDGEPRRGWWQRTFG